jgi:hypothetical protein
MSTFEIYAVLGLGAAIFTVFFSAVLVSAWRMLRDDGRLRLEQMLCRHGAKLNVAGERSPYEAAVAARRCVGCADKERCDAWLASGEREGFEAFCPNADFVGRSAP